jgi:hypothetical protein
VTWIAMALIFGRSPLTPTARSARGGLPHICVHLRSIGAICDFSFVSAASEKSAVAVG